MSDPSSSTSVANLRAFAKLYGYVRFFHPSDAAVGLDWDAFAVDGCRQVADLESREALREELTSLFAPIAPTVRVFEADEPAPPDPELAPADCDDLDVVAWQHKGVGLADDFRLYRSRRTNRKIERGPGERPRISQSIGADPYCGETVKLEGGVRTEEGEESAAAGFLVTVRRPEGEGETAPDRHEEFVATSEWTDLEIEFVVPGDAVGIEVAALLDGDGRVLFDRAELSVRKEDEDWERIAYPNWDFDVEELKGWGDGWELTGKDCEVCLRDDQRGRVAVLETAPEEPLFDERPVAGDALRRRLGRGLAVQLPVALYSRDGATIDSPEANRAALEERLDEVEFEDHRDRFTPAFRAAVVATIWNVAQHFFPYFDEIEADWEAALPRALEEVRTCRDWDQFAVAVDRLVAELRDGHAQITFSRRFGPEFEWLPVAFGQVGQQTVIVATAEGSGPVRVGDILREIGGLPVEDAIDKQRARISGSTQWRTRRALRQLRVGPAGESVSLTLSREGQTVTTRLDRGDHRGLDEERPPPLTEVESDTLYVDLTRLSDEEFEEAVDEMSEAKGLVFDVRGYPDKCAKRLLCHLADRSLRSIYHLIPKVLFPDRSMTAGWASVAGRWRLEPRSPRIDATCAFVTDARAISYAESILVIVEYYDLGAIVGSPTAGANGNVNAYEFSDGNRFLFTGMRVVKHDGSRHHLDGVRPTIRVERTVEGIRDGRDELLERAVQEVAASSGESEV